LVDIAADVRRAGEIIDRMRGLLKNRPPSASAVDLNHIIRAVTKLLASDAVIRRSTIAHELDPALPSIRGDPIQLQQVVLNLMLNALEAIDRGHRSERRVTVCTRVTGDAQVVLTVRDTGPGVGQEPHRLFEPFYSTKEAGLGVGLSISRTIVEAYGGSLLAENNDGGGANFHVRLPMRPETWQ
jgi:two-component system sensor kinase FixL